ncbi:MAG: hypothetical protein HY537_17620 [Deltaproteobacteria bacterium]|nr:hypothetical protein [Deltaproteobacteria bacterium]
MWRYIIAVSVLVLFQTDVRGEFHGSQNLIGAALLGARPVVQNEGWREIQEHDFNGFVADTYKARDAHAKQDLRKDSRYVRTREEREALETMFKSYGRIEEISLDCVEAKQLNYRRFRGTLKIDGKGGESGEVLPYVWFSSILHKPSIVATGKTIEIGAENYVYALSNEQEGNFQIFTIGPNRDYAIEITKKGSTIVCR